MPKPWSELLQERQREVQDAILDITWALVTEHGLRSVTMSQIAEQAGISRATLYKYFADVEAILLAHHQRHVTGHLTRLAELRDRPGNPIERLTAVLDAYALICYHRRRDGSAELGALLHRGDHVDRVQQQLIDLFSDLLAKAATTGDLRDDVPPAQMATYCLHALTAAGAVPTEAAAHQLVTIILAGLRPSR